MMNTIHVEIVSAEGHIYSGDANLVICPAKMGDVGIAPRHAPLMTTLRPGEVRVQAEGKDEVFLFVTGGILEVQPTQVTILADTAMREHELDEAAADDARRKAEEALKGATGREDLAHAQQQLVEAAARYRAAQKLKGKRKQL
ncbi:MAG: F0F1 ATP synthase subunit epsilon [Proteobacteria bacterium]|nr:MAG: F0F1 ATP synthase subunit epsilon [Pseudomonadota bacterium]MBC6945021.1 F0F1 ATP synthase subunit epsilon [Gammaproteobacteria bacterium]MCE7896787.1 F0F1 ATP synthase subunit epsilon [Gammaproteobacteria bacterium PRO8]MCQ3935241.1 F0F1 ATP synthase subunit epsilon [Gammaproteobacteria bacterium]MDL1879734.1 F0F1 ATP synthase subunit epsilon [Gammaproteobacteria bacterium PRO2]